MSANAYILVTIEPPRTLDVVKRLRAIPRAIVHEVLGPYDAVVEVEGDTPEDVTQTVRTKIRPIPGVTSTVTCLWMASPNQTPG